MTKDKALDLALEALEKSLPRLAPYGEQDWLDSRAAITAIKQSLAAPTVQPTAWPLATEEEKAGGWTLSYKFLESLSDRIDGRPAMETIESILMLTSSLTPPAQPTPASWMETVTANLVREGIGKHKARELAEHFYSLAQRPWVGLTDEEFEDIELRCRSTPFGKIEAMQKVEAKLKEKNNDR